MQGLSVFDLVTGLANKKHCIVSSPATAPAQMVDLKEEYVVVQEVFRGGVELRSAEKESMRCWSGL